MEHPPKQGLKQAIPESLVVIYPSFNGTSTKTRIETAIEVTTRNIANYVLMEHPPKQGLKLPN